MKKTDLLTKTFLFIVLMAMAFSMTFAVSDMESYAKEKDLQAPTLNASVSDGTLTVETEDTDSGIKAVYVNGYKFSNLTEGKLTIRMQQFDAGYEYFKVYAVDNSGNRSETSLVKNPYYQKVEGDNTENPAKELPVSAEATKATNATAVVTEHSKSSDNKQDVSKLSSEEQKKQAMKEAEGETDYSEKEFYTIKAASGKVFYLIIEDNKDGEQEQVYFLTEISENDLLNVTSDNSKTLPRNSVAEDSAIPMDEELLIEITEDTNEESVLIEEEVISQESAKSNPVIFYVVLLGIGVVAIGVAYYLKVVRKKEDDFIEDEDEEDEIIEDEYASDEADFFEED